MNGWCKLVAEDERTLRIGYSIEENESCDGILVYEKESEEFRIERLSEGADTFATNRFICPLRYHMLTKKLSAAAAYIATG